MLLKEKYGRVRGWGEAASVYGRAACSTQAAGIEHLFKHS